LAVLFFDAAAAALVVRRCSALHSNVDEVVDGTDALPVVPVEFRRNRRLVVERDGADAAFGDEEIQDDTDCSRIPGTQPQR